MADNLGLVNQKITAGGGFADVAEGGGVVVNLCEELVLAALPSGTAINISKGYQGNLMVVGARIVHEALGAGVTLKLGTDSDDDELIAATAAATAGTIELGFDAIFTLLSGNQLVLTSGGAVATGGVKVIVDYVNK